MDEARLQAYVNLVEQLLACADDEELNNILQANQEFIDPEFLQVMEKYATELEEQGNNNPAAWLRNIAQQLGQFGNIEKYQDYFNFLMEVLRKIWYDPSPHLIYPFLAQNLDKLDETCAEILYQWATHLFLTLNPLQFWESLNILTKFGNRIQEFPMGDHKSNIEIAIKAFKATLNFCNSDTYSYNWANSQYNLGNAYLKRLKGEEIDNIDMAIACYHESLRVYTPDTFFSEWSDAQNNLARTYTIKAEKSENVEVAIACYHESLKIYTFNAFPQQWASTQHALGDIYYNRIEGDKSENLEIAIAYYENSLKFYTSDNHPFYSATLQELLGLIYFGRIKEEKKEDLELAIYYYKESLKVYTLDTFPDKNWADNKRADMQNNLGRAYFDRVKGDKAENLEMAIYYYQESLNVHTLDAFPQNWADLQHNLGNAYSNRIKGDRAENLEIAIYYYQESFKVYPRDTFPKDWAITQNGLGLAYSVRIKGDKAKNLEQAIHSLCESLKIYTFDAFPFEWAMVQHNLGKAYGERIEGEKEDNLERAIHCYCESLKVRTFDDFPLKWALTQQNLAGAYIYRIRGDEAENFKNVIDCYLNALKIYTKESYPVNCVQTARNLGNFWYWGNVWQPATEAYHLAIEAVENTRLEALNPQRQQEILSDAMDVYHGIVQSYLNLNQKDRALEYVERSKTRYLVQLLTERDIYPKGDIPQTIITELDRLRRAIIGEEQQLAIQEQTRNRGVTLTLDQQKQPVLNDYTHLNYLKQELNQLIDGEITPIDPTFSLTQKVQTIPLSEIQSLIDQQTAILEWYISGETFLAFIVTSQELKVWQSSATDRDKLIDFIKNYREAYENNKTEWINNLNSRLNELSKILHIDELLDLVPRSCNRLIIIPHWFLHIIPLHCLPLKNGQFLYQRFSKGVGYIPSCQLLKLVQSSQRENFERLFAIKNPTRKGLKPLLGANLEIERISQEFDVEKTIIIGELEASEQTLENRRQELQASHCIHFSCHGKFNNESPRDSALMLADPEGNLGESANLTLAEVFEKLDLRECRLVTFSACESGIIESKADSISDEYVGLPSGFLFAGSSSVVSTLWTVDPLATTLFMTKFYHDLKRISIREQGSIAIVLNNTQTWLRTLSSKKLARIKNNSDFQKLLIEAFADNKRDRNKFKDLLEAAVKRQPYPFESPYYWTAFIATGV